MSKRKRDEYDLEPLQPLKKARLEGTSAFENMPLPSEIVSLIFESVERKELQNCTLVCRYWRECALDKLIGWMLFTSNEINIEYRDYPRVHNGVELYSEGDHWYNNQQKICDTWQRFYPGKPYLVDRTKKMLDKEGNIVAFCCGYSIGNESLSSLNEKLWRREFKSKQGPGNHRSWDVDIYLNLKELDRLVFKGEPIDGTKEIVRRVQTEVDLFLNTKQNLAPKEFNAAFIPFKPPRIEQPPSLSASVKLHNYQLDAISWMKSIESEVDRPFKYCYLVPWRSALVNSLFDIADQKIVWPDKANEYTREMHSKGGVLADEIGLGKTVEIIGLIASNPAPPDMKELQKDHDPKLYNSRATLVICPSHIAQQWVDQVAKYSDGKMKTYLLSTIAKLRAVSYHDIAEADVVVVPFTFLKNKNYLEQGMKGTKASLNKDTPIRRRPVVMKYLKEVKAKDGLATKSPILDHFHFHRIVLDEGHEAFKDQFLGNMIQFLQKNYAWYVTGTPFPDRDVIPYLKWYLEINDPEFNEGRTVPQRYESWIQSDLIYNNLVWRNTKESVDTEYNVPDTDEELVFVDFHPYETILNDQYEYTKNKIAQLKLCCGLFFEESTLERIKNQKITSLQTEIKHLNRRIAEARRLKQVYEQADTPLTDEQKARQSEYFDTVVEENEQKIVVLTEFLTRWNNTKSVLPEDPAADEQCKETNGVTEDERQKAEMIDTWGSKLTRLSQWLKELFEGDPQCRVILFSKSKRCSTVLVSPVPLLKGKVLPQDTSRLGLTASRTVANKAATLQQFGEENAPFKVILLSLEKTASGTHLIEATHVVLLDPMSGSAEEARAYESQAIGRAHRQGQTQRVIVVRFVVNDTAEHELYLRNKSTATDAPAIKTERSQLVRTNSLATVIAAAPNLRRSGSVSDLSNNTNLN